MPEKSLYELGDQQRMILVHLWTVGPASVREVWKHAGADRGLAYTTTLSTMQKLEKAGWLQHRADGRQYVYRPAVSRDEAERAATRKFVDRLFAGRADGMLFRLAEAGHAGAGSRPTLRSVVEFRRSIR